MFAAIVLAGLCSLITSLHCDPTIVTHECTRYQQVSVTVSPLLSHATADRRLLFASTGRVYRPHHQRSPSAVLVALILLLGGVEANPGPTTSNSSVSFGLVNACSVVHKAAPLHDLIADRKLDVLAVTETWMTTDAPDTIKLDTAPKGYQVVHQPRGSSADKRGGGVAIVHRDTIAARPLDVGQPSEFEVLAARLTLHVSVVCIYRPPGDVSQLFCQQFADLLDQFVTTKQRFLICGDFYCPGSGDCQLDARLDDILHSATTWSSMSTRPLAEGTFSIY